MNKKLWLFLGLLCLSFSVLGCEAWFDSGFRYEGLYEAKRSGYRMEMIAQGFWNRDSQQVYKSYRLIQFCPIAPQQGQSLRLTLRYSDELQTSVLGDDVGLMPLQIWDWRTSATVLRQALLQAGFNPIDTAELEETVRILESGEAVLEGQSSVMRVIRATSDSKYSFDHTRPMKKWIEPSELPTCDERSDGKS